MHNSDLKAVIDQLSSGFDDRVSYENITRRLLFGAGSPADEYLLLADGRRRRVERPKRKKIRHVSFVAKSRSEEGRRLRQGEKLSNSEVRRALRQEEAPTNAE